MADAAAASIALLALVVSITQLRWSQREATRRLTLDYLRGVVRQVQVIRDYDFRTSQSDVLAYYGGEVAMMSEACRTHLDLLDELDLLCLAITKDAIDGDIAREYLRSTFSAEIPDTIHFINQLRIDFRDPELYHHLYQVLPTLPAVTPRWATTYTPDAENPYEGSRENSRLRWGS